MEMNVVAVEIGTEVGGEGVEINYRDCGLMHDFVGDQIVSFMIDVEAEKTDAPGIMHIFIQGRGANPNHLWFHGCYGLNDHAQIGGVIFNRHLLLSGIPIRLDVMQTTVDEY